MFGETLASITEDGFSAGMMTLRTDMPPEKRYWRLDFEFETHSIHVDESRSLLVLADPYKQTIRFRSLITGEVHADVHWRGGGGERGLLEKVSVLDWGFWEDWMLFQDERNVDDQHQAMYSCSSVRTTGLYHWPSGRLIKVRASPTSNR